MKGHLSDMARLKVESHENRGTVEQPFGFVYFTDDSRVGYAPGIKETEESDGLFSGNWGGNTPTHFALAFKYLKEKGLL